MKMAKGKTSWFEKCGTLRVHGEYGRSFDEVYYAMTDPIHGEDEFVLIGLNSLLDKNIDEVNHTRSSRDPKMGIQNLRHSIAPPQS